MKAKTTSIMGVFKDKKSQRMVLIALLAIVAFIFYLNFLLKAQVVGVINAVVAMSDAGRNLKNTEKEIAKIPGYKTRLVSYEEKVGRYEKILPAEQEIPGLLESLSSMAKNSGVRIVGITPVMPKAAALAKGDVYQEMPILITARSGYHELGSFLSSLESADRFMKVVDIAIRYDNTTPRKHDVELLIVTYILLGNG